MRHPRGERRRAGEFAAGRAPLLVGLLVGLAVARAGGVGAGLLGLAAVGAEPAPVRQWPPPADMLPQPPAVFVDDASTGDWNTARRLRNAESGRDVSGRSGVVRQASGFVLRPTPEPTPERVVDRPGSSRGPVRAAGYESPRFESPRFEGALFEAADEREEEGDGAETAEESFVSLEESAIGPEGATDEGSNATWASYQAPRTGAAASAPRSARTAPRTAYSRVARAPNMFGDSHLPMRRFQAGGTNDDRTLAAPLGSTAAGSRRFAENDQVAPLDRVFFNYNHFSNAGGAVGSAGQTAFPPSDVDRYVFGLEKSLLDGLWSVEIRVAAAGSPAWSDQGDAYDAGLPGQLTLFAKHLLYADDVATIGAGLGVGLPLTSDITVATSDWLVRYRDETVHLAPYVGVVAQPDDAWFLHGVAQVDFSTGVERLDQIGLAGGDRTLAELSQQHLLYLDASIGRWLHRDDSARRLTGVAAVLELHYLSTLNDASTVAGTLTPRTSGTEFFSIGSPANRVDALQMTAGLHFQIGDWTDLRVGAAVPLRSGADRPFDAELLVGLNRHF